MKSFYIRRGHLHPLCPPVKCSVRWKRPAKGSVVANVCPYNTTRLPIDKYEVFHFRALRHGHDIRMAMQDQDLLASRGSRVCIYARHHGATDDVCITHSSRQNEAENGIPMPLVRLHFLQSRVNIQSQKPITLNAIFADLRPV